MTRRPSHPAPAACPVIIGCSPMIAWSRKLFLGRFLPNLAARATVPPFLGRAPLECAP